MKPSYIMSTLISDTLTQKLAHYQAPASVSELIHSTRIVFLVGVAGAGKDTIIGELLKSGKYHHIVSHTTRKPRHNHGILESDGLDYHFIDIEKLENMVNSHEFVEVKKVHSNVYGTSVAEIQSAKDKSEIAINEIDVQGIAEYRAISDTVIPIFLLPPSFDVWQERLKKRYGDTVDEDDLRERLMTARDEIEEALLKDYYEFVINEDLQKTIQIVDSIAHGSLSSAKNDEAKAVAQEILNRLNEVLQ